jgi:hypothetical protein
MISFKDCLGKLGWGVAALRSGANYLTCTVWLSKFIDLILVTPMRQEVLAAGLLPPASLEGPYFLYHLTRTEFNTQAAGRQTSEYSPIEIS